MYDEFWKVIWCSYSAMEILMYAWWADELMAALDVENAGNLGASQVENSQLTP